MSRPMRVLSVLSSSNQMYSGIGRAVFELSSRLSNRIEFEFVIDDLNEKNGELVRSFALPLGIPVHVGRGTKRAEALDNGNDDLPDLLRRGTWDAIECVCWANSATNSSVLAHCGEMAVIYTPHDQPAWTVPMGPGQAEFTERVHRAMIRRSDLVLCDSTWERGEIRHRAPDRNNATFMPLGCNFREFLPGPRSRKLQIVFVGDFNEPRKRFDRVIAVMERLRPAWPELRLVVIGNKSESAESRLPACIRPSCDLRGYVSQDVLRSTYAESAGVILLSDFEAFGIPILEALACGTPVFLSQLDATLSLFGNYKAANFCPPDDLEATVKIVEDVLRRGEASITEAVADRPRLQAQFDWDHLAEAKWRAVSAAWYRRNCWSWTA
ncbi:MAG: glycosyl transferase, group 1 [Planctomycetota bacterium]|nr:glycosyl transferase, group 1 [Planctomycetota bacterium]